MSLKFRFSPYIFFGMLLIPLLCFTLYLSVFHDSVMWIGFFIALIVSVLIFVGLKRTLISIDESLITYSRPFKCLEISIQELKEYGVYTQVGGNGNYLGKPIYFFRTNDDCEHILPIEHFPVNKTKKFSRFLNSLGFAPVHGDDMLSKFAVRKFYEEG
ncbi:MAG: hypothetical protein COB04_12370 [Gammaproteobacteria bacterium]|nr:MAG: hypothetical protein COB04_12370 [Gammaproteobacteria bacterium]